MSDQDVIRDFLSALLGDDPDLTDAARALHALAQAVEDLAQLIDNLRASAAE